MLAWGLRGSQERGSRGFDVVFVGWLAAHSGVVVGPLAGFPGIVKGFRACVL